MQRFCFALVACTLFLCANVSHAQVFGSRSDDSTRVRKQKKHREVLASDTLPSIFESQNSMADDTIKPKKHRRRNQSNDDTTAVFFKER
jgi:hypothetical protein